MNNKYNRNTPPMRSTDSMLTIRNPHLLGQ